jgi:hypothetical protein
MVYIGRRKAKARVFAGLSVALKFKNYDKNILQHDYVIRVDNLGQQMVF